MICQQSFGIFFEGARSMTSHEGLHESVQYMHVSVGETLVFKSLHHSFASIPFVHVHCGLQYLLVCVGATTTHVPPAPESPSNTRETAHVSSEELPNALQIALYC